VAATAIECTKRHPAPPLSAALIAFAGSPHTAGGADAKFIAFARNAHLLELRANLPGRAY